ncbi:MAG: hypothetical protein IPJ21_03275 [Sterolibacteriaceae bacterium]|nr:hypothetical protein [Sterolibacteriaceae bacterium]MBK9086677.1 hypothetical protein [Sterolibacteriaceae bacterium]
MKDFKDIVEFILGQKNPWAIAFVVAGVAFYGWRMIKETTNQGHSLREKSLLTLLTYVDQDVCKKHRFSVEQAFSQYYGRTLSYGEIVYLLAAPKPSYAIRDYLWAASYVVFDAASNRPILKMPRFWIQLRKFVSNLVKWGAFAGLVVALAGTVLAIGGQSPQDFLGAAVVMFATFTVLFWLALVDDRAIRAAERAAAGATPVQASCETS